MASESTRQDPVDTDEVIGGVPHVAHAGALAPHLVAPTESDGRLRRYRSVGRNERCTVTDDNQDSPSHGADGRTRRRERNVERVLDALIELAAEGRLDPSGEDIAERAGVSHRSLYRYFDDRTALQRAAIERVMEKIAPLLDIASIGEGALDDRISTFVRARTQTYWGFGPIARTAFSGTWDVVREGIESSRAMLYEQLVAQFRPELDMLNHSERRRTIAMLDVPFQFEALEYLVGHAGFDRDELVAALEEHLRLFLEPLAARRAAAT